MNALAHARRRSLVILALLLAGAAAAQQAIIVPEEACGREGNAADHGPFGRDRQRHVHYLHARLLRALPVGTQLRALAYRRDGSPAHPVMTRVRAGEARQRPAWLVRLGSPRVDPRTPPPEYPRVEDPAWQPVFLSRAVDFPDLPASAAGPAPFDLVFPFDAPFVYRGGHLGIEHVFLHRLGVSYDYAVDAVDARREPGRAWCLALPDEAGAFRFARDAEAHAGPGLVAGQSLPSLGWWGWSGARPSGASPDLDGARIAGAIGGPGEAATIDLLDGPAHALCALEIAMAPAILRVPLVTDQDGAARVQVRLPATAHWNDALLQARFRCSGTSTPALALRCGRLPFPGALDMSVVAGFPESHVEHGFVQVARGPVVQLRW